MMKIVTEGEMPGEDVDPFLKVPKTTYRYTTRYGRVEEKYNERTGIELLVVVDEPHVWITNLSTNKGVYVKDKGPTFNFKACIFCTGAQSALIQNLELGCELDVLREKGIEKYFKNNEEKTYTYQEDDEKVVLYINAISEEPGRIELWVKEELVIAYNYIEFKTGMEFDKRLFEPPEDVKYEERESFQL